MNPEPLPFKRILVALDGSDRDEGLVQMALQMSAILGSEVTFARVVDVWTGVRADDLDGSPANPEEEKLKAEIEQLVEKHAGSYQSHPQIKVLHGKPSERITHYSEYISADLVIIGSRGRGALKRALLGSTSSEVAANTRTSVLIIR